MDLRQIPRSQVEVGAISHTPSLSLSVIVLISFSYRSFAFPVPDISSLTISVHPCTEQSDLYVGSFTTQFLDG